jgi:hypothetical protein
MAEQRAKFIVEVTAGIIPGRPDEAHTRRYAITGEQWEAAAEPAELLAELNGRAQGFAALLMLQPNYLNWVRVDWLQP